MANASSIFLRGSYLPVSQAAPSPVEDSSVLAAAANPGVTSLAALADALQTTPSAIERSVERLRAEGLIDLTETDLRLSPVGERALKYASAR